MNVYVQPPKTKESFQDIFQLSFGHFTLYIRTYDLTQCTYTSAELMTMPAFSADREDEERLKTYILQRVPPGLKKDLET